MIRIQSTGSVGTWRAVTVLTVSIPTGQDDVKARDAKREHYSV